MNRWTRLLGTLTLAACICVALGIGTSYSWLYGGAILFGPGLGVLAIIYLAISSDTNGETATAQHADSEVDVAPAAAAAA